MTPFDNTDSDRALGVYMFEEVEREEDWTASQLAVHLLIAGTIAAAVVGLWVASRITI